MRYIPDWLLRLLIAVVLLFVVALVIHALGGFNLHIGFFRVSVSGRWMLLRRAAGG